MREGTYPPSDPQPHPYQLTKNKRWFDFDSVYKSNPDHEWLDHKYWYNTFFFFFFLSFFSFFLFSSCMSVYYYQFKCSLTSFWCSLYMLFLINKPLIVSWTALWGMIKVYWLDSQCIDLTVKPWLDLRVSASSLSRCSDDVTSGSDLAASLVVPKTSSHGGPRTGSPGQAPAWLSHSSWALPSSDNTPFFSTVFPKPTVP